MAALYDEIGKMQVYALPFYFETVVYAANGRAVDADKYQARCGKELTAGIPVAANRPAIVPGLRLCR